MPFLHHLFVLLFRALSTLLSSARFLTSSASLSCVLGPVSCLPFLLAGSAAQSAAHLASTPGNQNSFPSTVFFNFFPKLFSGHRLTDQMTNIFSAYAAPEAMIA
uniref:Putative secreted protein n=1 Tax=Ixodes ricinus TaxID=34613 RepID=A0A147BCD6_IXORI